MASFPPSSNPLPAVICGGGVIGTSIAYHLGLKGVRSIVVERTGIANAASGKSGGFLALDWCSGLAVDALARRSFALHAELATRLREELGLEWGYRTLDTVSVVASERRDMSSFARQAAPSWLDARSAVHSRLGTTKTTAQLEPREFTRALMTAAETRGAQLLEGTVEGIELSHGGRRVTGVYVDGNLIETDVVVIAMGPWSILACQWLSLPAVYGLKGHSIVFEFEPADPQALFVEIETGTGSVESPEVMPRPNGTTYVCGLSSEAPLPMDPAAVEGDDGAFERLHTLTSTFSPELGAARVLTRGACYRPITSDGMPLIGRIPGVDGAYVATGHNVWGMLNAPATGEVLAELITDGESRTIPIAPFSPNRLAPFDPGRGSAP